MVESRVSDRVGERVGERVGGGSVRRSVTNCILIKVDRMFLV